MRILSAALLSVGALQADAFDFRGVPPEASLVFATESTAGLAISNSPGMQALRARMQKSQAAEIGGFDVEKAVKEATGFDLSSPDIAFAGGLIGGFSEDPDFVLIVRGSYDSNRLDAYCTSQGVKSVQAGTINGWDLQGLVNSFGPSSPGSVKPGSPAVFPYDDKTLVITKPARAAKVFAALKGAGRSFTPGPESSGASSQVGKGYFFMAASSSLMPPTPDDRTGFKGMHAAMGEKGDAQVMKLEVRFESPAKAAPFAAQAQGMLAMMPLMVAGDPAAPKSPADQAKARLASDLIAGIAPVEHQGDRVVFTASWSTERLLTMLNQLVDQAEVEAKDDVNLFGRPATSPRKK
ncbi:MAG: hypothetical protein ACO3ND_09450 [Opitutales bacterium]